MHAYTNVFVYKYTCVKIHVCKWTGRPTARTPTRLGVCAWERERERAKEKEWCTHAHTYAYTCARTCTKNIYAHNKLRINKCIGVHVLWEEERWVCGRESKIREGGREEATAGGTTRGNGKERQRKTESQVSRINESYRTSHVAHINK